MQHIVCTLVKCLSTERKVDCLSRKLKVQQGVIHKLSPLCSDDTSLRLLCSFKHQLNYEIVFLPMVQIKFFNVKTHHSVQDLYKFHYTDMHYLGVFCISK